MNSIATKFNFWIKETISNRPLKIFRIVFAAIWLVYDLLDFSFGELSRNFVVDANPPLHALAICQVLLIICELGLLLGWRARFFAFLCFGFRFWEASFFDLNDYFYFCTTALILSQCEISNGKNAQTPKWSRDVLIIQTGWIYFASALLKLNPLWLSGGDLFTRFRILSFDLGWLYPEFMKKMVFSMPFDSALAWFTVIAEFGIAILLFTRWSKRTLFILTMGVHLTAALTLNVWFFGASLISQVVILNLKYDPPHIE